MKPLFNSPTGLDVILGDQKYHNPNRFFSHWIYNRYFDSTPFLLQKFTNPIQSIYLTSAISKIIFQILLIYLLSMFITGKRNVFKLDFIIAAVLITPLFQTNGYRSYMGIIDSSITYTFFYAMPFILLMLYFSPFIFHHLFLKHIMKKSLQ